MSLLWYANFDPLNILSSIVLETSVATHTMCIQRMLHRSSLFYQGSSKVPQRRLRITITMIIAKESVTRTFGIFCSPYQAKVQKYFWTGSTQSTVSYTNLKWWFLHQKMPVLVKIQWQCHNSSMIKSVKVLYYRTPTLFHNRSIHSSRYTTATGYIAHPHHHIIQSHRFDHKQHNIKKPLQAERFTCQTPPFNKNRLLYILNAMEAFHPNE